MKVCLLIDSCCIESHTEVVLANVVVIFVWNMWLCYVVFEDVIFIHSLSYMCVIL